MRWVRPVKQARSERTRERFLDAAERLLSRGRTFDDVAVADLAREARSSVGAFYTRFRDKDALLHTLQVRFCSEGSATAQEALDPARWEGVELEWLVGAFVQFAVATYGAQRGLRRAFLAQMFSGSEFRERAAALSEETCSCLARVLAAQRPDREAGEIRAAVDVCHRAVYGILDQIALFGPLPPAGVEMDAQTLTHELIHLCLGYLDRRLPAAARVKPR